MSASSLFPTITKERLRKEYVGKQLKDVAIPSPVLELSKVKTNCRRMLEAAKSLDFGWRAHIKTHKTTELTQLQVGDNGPANIIVSTILEAENILPLLLEYQQSGREVNLLYSFPVSPASVQRLSAIAKALGPKNLSLLVDHPSQLTSVYEISELSSTPPSIFIKIDMGYHRAGVIPSTEACSTLITSVLSLEKSGAAHLLGIYAHAGQSYSSTSTTSAIDYLRQEFEALLIVTTSIQSDSPNHPLVLSVGATPTTTSVQNLLLSREDSESEEGKAISALNATVESIRNLNCKIEVHAGVHCVLDLQQLATHALPGTLLGYDDLALTVLAEVVSIYPGRGKDGATDVLIAAGSLALGREPCKAYPGWGILTPWNIDGATTPSVGVELHSGWHVGKISQEHGILQWTGKVGEEEKLEIGQKVRVWPNHACITGSGFGWYLIVDGSDEIIDVWPRWNGW